MVMIPSAQMSKPTKGSRPSALTKTKLNVMRDSAKALALALSTAFMATAFMAPSFAQSQLQGEVRSTHGAWRIMCETPPGASAEQCGLIQNMESDSRPEAGMSVQILKTADKQATMLTIIAPLGVLVPLGVRISVDGQDYGRADFARCLITGCRSQIELDDQTLSLLKKSNQAVFAIFETPEEGIGFPLDLTGLTDGLGALGNIN